MNFGKNLENIRKDRNISQDDLGKKINLSRDNIVEYESGENYPNLDLLKKISKVLKCCIYDLVFEELKDFDKFSDEVKNFVKEKTSSKKELIISTSKFMYVLSKILKIIFTISLALIVLSMITVLVLFSKISFKNNKIELFNHSIDYVVKDNNIKLYYESDVIVDTNINYIDITKYLSNEKKPELIIMSEVTLVTISLILVILILIFDKLSLIFKSIKEEFRPFTSTNYINLRIISILVILSLIIELVFEIVLRLIYRVNISFNLTGLFSSIIIYLLSYVFEYGYKKELCNE